MCACVFVMPSLHQTWTNNTALAILLAIVLLPTHQRLPTERGGKKALLIQEKLLALIV